MADPPSRADMEECPVCGEADLEVLHETAEHRTVHCPACGETRTLAPPRVRRSGLRLVLSHGDRSWSDRLEVAADERVAVGDEFEHDGSRYLVTGVERRDGVAATAAPARDLRTCYAKRFDEVALRFTLNEGETTRSLESEVPPERRIHVGEVLEVQGRKVVVKALKSDLNRTVRRGFLYARNVRRVFCDPASPGAQLGPPRRMMGPRGPPGGRGRGTRGGRTGRRST